VRLVREKGKMTLAIGDGGNDVAMIQAANVGVGVRGKEGLQAARASDYSVANFQSLQQLLLVHGHFSYMRTSLVAQYSFYKSICFCCIQIAFGFFSSFSGSTLFNSICITGYNAILFFPIVTFILDKHVPTQVSNTHPILYRHAAKGTAFNLTTFVWWVARAIMHATIIFAVTIESRGVAYHMATHGFPSEYETLGMVAFCAYLWVQSLTMLMELHNIALFNVGFIWAFHVLCFALLWVTNILTSFNSLNPYYGVSMTFADLQFWISNLLITVACIVPVAAGQMWNFNYRPKLADILRYAYVRMGLTGRGHGGSQSNSKAHLTAAEPEQKSADPR